MKDKKSKNKKRRSYSDSESRQKSSDRDPSRERKQKKKQKRHSSRYKRESQDRNKESKRKHRIKKDKKSQKKQRINSSQQRSRSRQKLQENKQKLKTEYQKRGWESSPERKQQQDQIKNQVNLQQPQPPKKQQPNFQPSGILLQFYNARQGISLKFHEPAQAHKPINQWRIYPFKDNSNLNPIILKQSCYLIGKDERVCDILCQNSSISRQHAVLQFRSQYKMQIEGNYEMQVKPYIMDLQSTNGTHLNDQRIQASKYYELLNKDVLKFGLSDRQYVMFKVPQSQEDER